MEIAPKPKISFLVNTVLDINSFSCWDLALSHCVQFSFSQRATFQLRTATEDESIVKQILEDNDYPEPTTTSPQDLREEASEDPRTSSTPPLSQALHPTPPSSQALHQYVHTLYGWGYAQRTHASLALAYAHKLAQWTHSDRSLPPPPYPFRNFQAQELPQPPPFLESHPTTLTHNPRVIPLVYPSPRTPFFPTQASPQHTFTYPPQACQSVAPTRHVLRKREREGASSDTP